ncbi:hypothetical protein LBMAG53_39310 [Planctomycetota bacterium]|nr:hypothetical protein LBMAG53_39310 [Planctomycetota bacterium]
MSAKRSLLCLAVAAWWLRGVAHSAEILAVLSGDQAPYRAAGEGLVKGLSNDRVTICLLSELAERRDQLAAAKVVVAVGTESANALARPGGPAVPVIYCLVPQGAAESLPPALGGVAADVPLMTQVALIAEALPTASRLGMVYRGDREAGLRQMAAVKAALPKGWELVCEAADQHPGIASAIDALLAKRPDVVWTAADGGVWNEPAIRALLLTALRRRVPVFGFSPAFVRAGAMIGVGTEPADQGDQAAALVRAALGGSAATRLGPEHFQIAINLVVARKLGIELPAKLVDRADQVVRP